MIVVDQTRKFEGIYSIVNPPFIASNTEKKVRLQELPHKSHISTKR